MIVSPGPSLLNPVLPPPFALLQSLSQSVSPSPSRTTFTPLTFYYTLTNLPPRRPFNCSPYPFLFSLSVCSLCVLRLHLLVLWCPNVLIPHSAWLSKKNHTGHATHQLIDNVLQFLKYTKNSNVCLRIQKSKMVTGVKLQLTVVSPAKKCLKIYRIQS